MAWPEPAATTNPRGSNSSTKFPIIALAMAIGVLLVAIGFARGRSAEPWASTFYWAGLIAVFLCPTMMLVGRRTVAFREGVAIALSLAIATYAIKECYAPLRFTFIDEFLHLPTVYSILNTSHLFNLNSSLPASPYYPALEILTALTSLTGHVSVAVASVVILFALHVIATLAIYFLGYEISGNAKISALAVVIYATGGDYLFFNSYFAYQSIGLPFAILTLLCFVKMTRAPKSREIILWTTSTVVFGVATIVSHHVSSYMMLILLGFLVFVEVLRPRSNLVRTSASIALVAIATSTILWDVVIAKGTISYLRIATSQLLSGGSYLSTIDSRLLTKSGQSFISPNGSPTLVPIGDSTLEYVWVLLISISLVIGLISIWNHRNRTTTQLLSWSAAGALTVFIALAIRIVSPSVGGELTSRMLSFALIPGSLVCAIGVNSLSRFWLHSRTTGIRLGSVGRLRWLSLIAFIALLEPGGIASGWPPFYARLPGPYLVGGRDRSIDSYELAAASWASTHLPRNAAFASDQTDSDLISTIAGLDATGAPVTAILFTSTNLSPLLTAAVRSLHLEFIVVNSQIASGIPVDGQPIFRNDPFQGQYTAPIPSRSLSKFDGLPGVSKIYVGGSISVYDVRSSLFGSR